MLEDVTCAYVVVHRMYQDCLDDLPCVVVLSQWDFPNKGALKTEDFILRHGSHDICSTLNCYESQS
jgi:hypothetical protein